jgi:hypothetical protein
LVLTGHKMWPLEKRKQRRKTARTEANDQKRRGKFAAVYGYPYKYQRVTICYTPAIAAARQLNTIIMYQLLEYYANILLISVIILIHFIGQNGMWSLHVTFVHCKITLPVLQRKASDSNESLDSTVDQVFHTKRLLSVCLKAHTTHPTSDGCTMDTLMLLPCICQHWVWVLCSRLLLFSNVNFVNKLLQGQPEEALEHGIAIGDMKYTSEY